MRDGMRRTATAMIAAAACAFGHHSLHATYFLDQQETIQGKIAQFLLRNPHSFLQVDAPDGSGVVQRWAVEWGAGGQLAARGIGRDTLMPGDQVTITMSPGQRPQDHRGLLRILRRPSDGFEWGTKPGEEPVEWGPARK
jgi:hypothetical protein